MKINTKADRRERIHLRQRKRIMGTTERPRLSVFRSNLHIYAQLIDDLAGVTLAAASSQSPDIKKSFAYGGNVKAAKAVGEALAAAAKAKGIGLAAFDRGHYKFHGRVKALAEAANAAGLKCTEPKKPRPAEETPAPKAKAEKPEKPEKAAKPKKEKAPAPA